MSYDVKSLFTSIPQDLAITCLRQALDDDDTLLERTLLGTPDIINLSKICLDATIFQYESKFYKQIHGTPMGSPISVVIAEVTMQEIESKILSTAPCKPLFWKRYVDDCFTAIPTDNIDLFMEYISSINDCIKFTIEKKRTQYKSPKTMMAVLQLVFIANRLIQVDI